MVFGYFTLAVALAISAIAEFYSIAGLIAIFAASPWAVAIMGAALGVGKITAAVWLKLNWHRASWTYKLYLVPAVAFLMALTSMGIFGYLSKAHSEQSLVSGDAQAQLAIYDEKIKTQRDAIELNRRTLEQMDQAVDQVLSRSTNVQGATRSAQLRRSQQAERARLLKEIEQSQQTIAQINEQRAPIANEIRKIEAEVGPIKYIAAMIYGDNPDTNLLEQAVRWVIIMIVIVFDPLALVLILAAQQSLRWYREEQQSMPVQAATEPATEPVAPEPLVEPPVEPPAETPSEPVPEPTLRERYPYLFRPFAHFSALRPMVATPTTPEIHLDDPVDVQQPVTEPATESLSPLPNASVEELGFGVTFPAWSREHKGLTFVRTDKTPHKVYKFNGLQWIEVDKNQSVSYTYNNAYLDYLISTIAQGKYDADMLTDNERDQLATRLSQNK